MVRKTTKAATYLFNADVQHIVDFIQSSNMDKQFLTK